jgi:hypothetical protein
MRAPAARLCGSVRSGFANRRGARHPRSNGFGIFGSAASIAEKAMRGTACHRTDGNRRITHTMLMKHAPVVRTDPGTASLRVPDESAWTARGLLKSGRDYDEIECQSAIAGFMAEHLDRNDIVE